MKKALVGVSVIAALEGGFSATSAEIKPLSPDQVLVAKAIQASGWSGCVSLKHYEGNRSYATGAEGLQLCPSITISDTDFSQGPRYYEHTIGHEVCHEVVGLQHNHDSVFRTCMDQVDRAEGFESTYQSGIEYPVRVQDNVTGQVWNW